MAKRKTTKEPKFTIEDLHNVQTAFTHIKEDEKCNIMMTRLDEDDENLLSVEPIKLNYVLKSKEDLEQPLETLNFRALIYALKDENKKLSGKLIKSIEFSDNLILINLKENKNNGKKKKETKPKNTSKRKTTKKS